MKLLEIFDTRPEVKWTRDDHRNYGSFALDGVTYTLEADGYEALNLNLLDIGFNREGSISAVRGEKPAAKVIGAVMNGLLPKIKELNPDVVLLSVQKSSGLVESRKSIYDAMLRLLMQQTRFTTTTPWVENENGFYKLLSQRRLTAEEEEKFISAVSKE